MDEQHDQLELDSLEELVARDVAEMIGLAGLAGPDGKPNREAFADRLEPMVRAAHVDVPGDRPQVIVWAHDLTAEVFPDAASPATWIEQEDPKRAAEVWSKLRQQVTRTLSTDPESGALQRRFAANGGLVLCEVQKKPQGGDRGYYVTRHPKCITEDLSTPARRKAVAANDKLAAITEMAIERVPDHARTFNREFNSAQKAITEGAKLRVRGALEAATGVDAPVSDDGDE